MNIYVRTLSAGLLTLMSLPAAALFHLWDIHEVYSNADGSVQFIELTTSSDFQDLLDTHTMTASSDGEVVSIDLSNLPSSSTAGRRVLLATPGFSDLPGGVEPDFQIPAAFFDPAATSIELNFAEGADVFSFSGASLPTDGSLSLLRDESTAVNSPENFAGVTSEIPFFFDGFEL